MTLSQRLNFSDKEQPGAIKIKKWHNVNFYETLCQYCADNNIDLSDISDADFDGASVIMEQHGQLDKSTDHYYFWID